MSTSTERNLEYCSITVIIKDNDEDNDCLFDDAGLAFSSVADGSQMICDRRFCDSVAYLLINFGQFWYIIGHVWKAVADIYNPSTTELNPNSIVITDH